MPPEVVTPAPSEQPSDEAKAWAELAAEVGVEEVETPPEPVKEPAKEPGEGEPEPVKKPEGEAKPEPTPAELKAQIENLNKAVKAERAERQTWQQRVNHYDEFIKQLREGRQQKQEKEPEPPKIPDVNEDPIGHFAARLELAEKALQQAHQGTQQTQQQLQAQTEEQQFWNAVTMSEEQERTSSPTITVDGKQVSDYDLACQHLEGTRIAELEMMLPDDSAGAIQAAQRAGLPSPGHLRAAMLNQDRIAVARHAMAIGMSPAKLYYSLAKQRGYQSPQQQPALNGKEKGKVQITALQKGQKAAATISGGGGKGAKDDMALADLVDLFTEDPEEFDVMWEKMAASGRLG